MIDLDFGTDVEDPTKVVPEEELPFEALDVNNIVQEEDLESIRTVDVWVADLPDPKHTATLLKWIKQTGLEHSSLMHLKRARKSDSGVTVLLSSLELHPSPPPIPPEMESFKVYQLKVPAYPAVTITSMKIKQSIWPVMYAPPRKYELEEWTAGGVKWATVIMKQTIVYALSDEREGEIPVASGVPTPYSPGEQPMLEFLVGDTRTSKHHPLRHSILSLTREVGEASFNQPEDPIPEEPRQNGSNYLLTSRMLFTTHEPCIMCSMALLHSRVAKVMYLVAMNKTGGCGGSTCLPRLEGVNHRFGILRWKERDRASLGLSEEDWTKLEVGKDLDA
ncbi:hypothetical protein BDM02DRAFT_3151652 [Thelephora ganbajun]|uniref:Uncharacterized protein n=1 Tax=Thelephora ganbajun TaxID=370292 RepID=A0ACB6Z1H4_THEGA|nr:hypothetical protein BDM02DRAFT_3151652 [Thelephora ganbajun]